jgi:hypothetical protein
MNKSDFRSKQFLVPRSSRGTALIECAICLPVMMVVALGCLDLARVYRDQATLSFAVRQGSFRGCCQNFSDQQQDLLEAEIRGAIILEMETMEEFDVSKLSVSIDVVREDEENFYVVVEATYPFSSLFGNQFLQLDLELKHRMAAHRFQ